MYLYLYITVKPSEQAIGPVHKVAHPHGIAPTFLKLNLWSPGAGFIPITSTKGINQKKEGNCKKKISFMHTIRFITIFKIWVQFRVGAIPRLPIGPYKSAILISF